MSYKRFAQGPETQKGGGRVPTSALPEWKGTTKKTLQISFGKWKVSLTEVSAKEQ